MWRHRAGMIGGLTVTLALTRPGVAWANGAPDIPDPPAPTQSGATQHRPEDPGEVDEDLSRGGTRTGALELGLGTVTAAVFGVLVGRGTWELVEGQKLARACRTGTSVDPACDGGLVFGGDPAVRHRIAAGLAFGFAVPIAVASGFLLARGIRIHRDYRRFKRAELSLVPGGLRLRF